MNNSHTLLHEEFVKPEATQPKGLTQDELLALPIGPASAPPRSSIGKSSTANSDLTAWGSGTRSPAAMEAPFARAVGNLLRLGLTRPTIGRSVKNCLRLDLASQGRGEKEGFFTDSQSRADEFDNWVSNKSFGPKGSLKGRTGSLRSQQPKRTKNKAWMGVELGLGLEVGLLGGLLIGEMASDVGDEAAYADGYGDR
ncbi:Unknown protein [Striga hermonthica]|uniref:Uncharacterized protein n=1 Tax=Striga hermonthica TaxID=68872 RepID=A0A9N7MYR0_STRHE|nr:Unknown protein [Striga hermonthica]